jgi:hypothetical protein
MPLMYLPFIIYSAMLDVMFQDWGERKDRSTIIAESDLPSPAPSQVQGGI